MPRRATHLNQLNEKTTTTRRRRKLGDKAKEEQGKKAEDDKEEKSGKRTIKAHTQDTKTYKQNIKRK